MYTRVKMEQLWYHQMLSPDHNWISQKACRIGSPNLWLLGTEFTLQRLLSLQLFELVTLYADPWDRCSVLRSKEETDTEAHRSNA